MKNIFNPRRTKNQKKSLNDIEKRLDKIERLIVENRTHGGQYHWTKQMKRDLKIMLVAGAIGLATGVSLCAWLRFKD